LTAVAVLTGIAVSRGPSPATAETEAAPVAVSETRSAAAPAVKARSGILIDRRSGKVLWSRDAGLRLAPASVTKIMTALLVLERYNDLERRITAPRSVVDHQVVAIGLRPGDRISVKQALRALMTKSANDACLTLATAVAGSEGRFVKLMNRRATKLGLTHTRFVNSRGSPEPGHYSSARDLAALGRYAMRDARFRDLVRAKTRVITWPPSHKVRVTSHNRLLDYAWGDGIKTGATKESKMVLVGSGTPGPLAVPLIVVTMREPNRAREKKDAVALFRWGAGLYERRQLVSAGNPIAQLTVSGGGPVDVVAAADLSAVTRKAASVTRSLQLPAEPLAQRPAEGEALGAATYRADGVVLGRVDLVAATTAGPSGQ
jgi:D-alanyl-D-alanine carboxypeptidase (penicillin-binding protein 5/6)